MKIGIDLGGSHIAIGVVDTKGFIIEKIEKRITSKERKNIESCIEENIIDNVQKMQQKYDITEIGIAVPGTIKGEIIVKSVNLGLKDYNIVEILKKQLELPIKIRNDAKSAALAENKYGVLKPYKRSIFLTLGTGIGGAVIINNGLLDTGDLPGCEIGHTIIKKDGIECKCGKRGCFERYASMKSFKDKLRRELGLDEKTRGQELLDMIRKNSPENPNYEKINSVINEFVEDVSIGLSNLINIFEPEAIGIGGSFVFFEDIFLTKIKDKLLNSNLLFNKRDNLIIEIAILNNDAGIIGSIL